MICLLAVLGTLVVIFEILNASIAAGRMSWNCSGDLVVCKRSVVHRSECSMCTVCAELLETLSSINTPNGLLRSVEGFNARYVKVHAGCFCKDCCKFRLSFAVQQRLT